jgi:hypothetical protein
MTRALHRWMDRLSWIALLALPAVTRAGDSSSIGFSYDAEGDCPDAATFVELVRAKAPGARLETNASPRADVVVVLRAANAEATGKLTVRRPDGSQYVRQVQGSSCGEVAPALAFVLALALSGEDEPRPSARPREVPSAALSSETVPPAPPVWRWSLSGELGMRTGLAPSWSPIERLAFDLGRVMPSVVAPRFELALSHAEAVTRIDRVGSTRFGWMSGRLGGCPLSVRPFGPLELVPCAGVDLGIISASGETSTMGGQGHETSSFWLSAFGGLRLQAPVMRPIFVRAEAELTLSLTPYRFAFDRPDTPVYEIPLVGGGAYAGVAVQFP